MISKRERAHLFLFIVNLFYGAGFTISKLIMPSFIKPFGFIALRVSTTSVLFLLLQKFFIREKVEKKDWPLLALCGLFGVVINQEMFFLGLSITTPINASLIMIMTPILVFAMSFFLAHEKATWQKVLGLGLGVAGALLILSGKNFNFSTTTLWGDVCILINAASYAVYLVIVRPLMKKYHPLTVITWVFLFGLVPVLAFGYNQVTAIEWSSFQTGTWLAFLFVIICTTFLAYLLNILALREVNSSVVGVYIYLQPILATLISVGLNQDRVTWLKVLAGTLIFIGVYLVSNSKPISFRRKREEKDLSDNLFLE